MPDITPQFEPSNTGLRVTLAQVALQSKRFPLFEKIISLTSRRHPGSELAVSLQFLRANYLAEFKKDDTGALNLLYTILGENAHPWHLCIAVLHRALNVPQAQGSALDYSAGP